MKKQNQFKLIWLVPVVIIAATAVTVVIFGLGSKGVSGTPGYKVKLDFNSPPVVKDLTVDLPADWCDKTPDYIRFNWEFEDPDPGDTQSAYQIKVTKISSGYTHESEVLPCSGEGCLSHTAQEINSAMGSNFIWYDPTEQGYTWRITVWDSQEAPSDEVEGPGFISPKHAYPDLTGSCEFTWLPDPPIALEPVEFKDNTSFGEGSINQSWFWDFSDDPDAVPSWSDLQNPTATPSAQGDWDVTLTVTDDAGTCSESINVNVAKPLPKWEEVGP